MIRQLLLVEVMIVLVGSDSYNSLCPTTASDPFCLYLINFWLIILKFEEPKLLASSLT